MAYTEQKTRALNQAQGRVLISTSSGEEEVVIKKVGNIGVFHYIETHNKTIDLDLITRIKEPITKKVLFPVF